MELACLEVTVRRIVVESDMSAPGFCMWAWVIGYRLSVADVGMADIRPTGVEGLAHCFGTLHVLDRERQWI
jgi:hypothetical protein